MNPKKQADDRKNDIPIEMFRIYYLILRKTYSNKYK